MLAGGFQETEVGYNRVRVFGKKRNQLTENKAWRRTGCAVRGAKVSRLAAGVDLLCRSSQ